MLFNIVKNECQIVTASVSSYQTWKVSYGLFHDFRKNRKGEIKNIIMKISNDNLLHEFFKLS